jgi:hypothetical protein
MGVTSAEEITAGPISLRLIVRQTMSRVVNLLLVIRTQVQYGGGSQVLSHLIYVIRWDHGGTVRLSRARAWSEKKEEILFTLFNLFYEFSWFKSKYKRRIPLKITY